MNTSKLIYGIDLLDYDQMDLRDSHKWLVETKFAPKALDQATNKLIQKKGRFARISAKSLALEMERLNYFRIIEDLTGVIQHTSEYEL